MAVMVVFMREEWTDWWTGKKTRVQQKEPRRRGEGKSGGRSATGAHLKFGTSPIRIVWSRRSWTRAANVPELKIEN
jgi:hypothetical protein